jgi:hypothetical protein
MINILLSGGIKMKKLAIILAVLLVPMMAFGMDTISDTDLNQVTGQAGVSIALTSIRIENSGGTTSYGDSDQGKWVSIVGSQTSVRTIGFHASRPLCYDTLTIDIVDLNNVEGWNLNSMVVASDRPVNSDAAVKITLCDIIQIEESASQIKTIYMSDGPDPALANVDEVIQIYSAGGTTRIIGADMGSDFATYNAAFVASTNLTGATYFSGNNTTILISAH